MLRGVESNAAAAAMCSTPTRLDAREFLGTLELDQHIQDIFKRASHLSLHQAF